MMVGSQRFLPFGPHHVLAVILGGGQGTRLFPLTQDRAKPAVPQGGKYRLVDIPISNCINSGLVRILLLTQFNSASLHRHIIDKNARVGDHCLISPSGKPEQADHPLYFIRDGVVVITKNGVVPHGTVI